MPTKTIRGVEFSFENEVEFGKLYEEVFKEQVYYVELDKLDPLIIDCGANIGLTTIYYKQLYPDSKIIAFEPDPKNFALLQQNIQANRFVGILCLPKAVWSNEGTMNLYVDSEQTNIWRSNSSLFPGAWTGKQATLPLTVQTVRLSTFITQKVDILKLDVEKAESVVLSEIKDVLNLVRHIFVEFHATADHRPESVVTLLLNAGFELTVFYEHGIIPINRMTHRKPSLYLIEGMRKN